MLNFQPPNSAKLVMAFARATGFNFAMHKSLLPAASIFLGAIIFAGCTSTKNPSAQTVFQNLPTNCDPKIVGGKVSANFLPRKIYYNTEEIGRAHV